MKIGVITFWQSHDNYGQILQGFALQHVLSNLGHNSFIIRYGFHEKRFPKSFLDRVFAKLHLYTCYLNLKDLICLYVLGRNEGGRNFNMFRHQRMNWSKRFYNYYSDLVSDPPKADIYITGSDQVWAQMLSNKENRTFFLDFGSENVKRIAYAPSFAVREYPKDLNLLLYEQLTKLDAISVRERTGVDICQKVGIDAVEVLDPTLLLLGDDYRKIAKKTNNRNYALIYHVNIESAKEIYWNEFQQYNSVCNIQSVAIYANPHAGMDMEFLSGANYCYPSIEEWLGLIDSANYVLTTSFHGMVFSILFHKPFVVCLRKESLYAGNDRIVTLLAKLNLESRIYIPGRNIRDMISDSIDWDSVDKNLNKLRIDSINFLKSGIC